jgi:hypothetical protein
MLIPSYFLVKYSIDLSFNVGCFLLKCHFSRVREGLTSNHTKQQRGYTFMCSKPEFMIFRIITASFSYLRRILTSTISVWFFHCRFSSHKCFDTAYCVLSSSKSAVSFIVFLRNWSILNASLVIL